MKKKGMKRRIYNGTVAHVYQHSIKFNIIFYDYKDFLCYFTIVSVATQRYNVKVLGLTIMVDHVHSLIKAENTREISRFIQEIQSRFARQYNRSMGIEARNIWQARFGMACKSDAKACRTAIAYLYNNGVEKHLADRAENYPWNFLAYKNSEHPFSDSSKTISARLKKSMTMAKNAYNLCHPLKPALIDLLTRSLTDSEIRFFTDSCISMYNFIDYEACEEYYKDFESMLIAINSNTGSEYEIREPSVNKDDRVYRQMSEWTMVIEPSIRNCREIQHLPLERRHQIADSMLVSHPEWRPYQVKKFLHLE